MQRREGICAGVRDRSSGDVGAVVQKLIKATTLPPGYSADIGGQMQEQAKAFAGLLGAMALAMIFGMLPLALALNDGGEIQAPMGRASAAG